MNDLKFHDVLEQYLKDIRSTASSQNTADAINQYLPEKKRLTRQAVSQWARKGQADEGIFYALLHHAPKATPEYKLAYDALSALGCFQNN